ncbi:L-type lectin family protein [Levilactobacillus enshiensis]|uniref:hypothetical protein n=1 Tax=Levilactobacillus enshiensis TaxID=2590213 RepID=UPI00117BD22A|nr:hypothetical protein [Levilactobacillus enshiensis]
MSMRVKQILTSVVLAITVGVIGTGKIMAHADDDYNHAIATMPHGLPIKGYFDIPSFANSVVPNSAMTADSPTDNTQAVQITNAANQVGSIWADRSKYYFDFTKNQQATMWMYFGNKGSTAAGDGMAFVIQNDSRGEQAIATNGTSSAPSVGQTLGTWGYATTKAGESEKDVASHAIQNSWALEFDTFTNNQIPTSATNVPSSFDFQVSSMGSQPHISANYPAQASTYLTMSMDKFSYTRMDHGLDSALYGGPLIKTPLSDGHWHHVTIDYKAPTDGSTTGQMTYTINDRQPADGAAQTMRSTTTKFDYSKLKDPDTTGTHAANTAMWGFTGSTGTNWENNLVVFEQMPGLVNASATAKVYDRSELDGSGQPIEVPAGQNVYGGDLLRLDYNLSYDTGRVDWDDINAAVRIPNNVTVTSGKIAYANGKTETVDMNNLSGQNLTFKLGQLLNKSNQTAKISLYGKADNPATTTTVDTQASTFSGPNAIVTANTPVFKIVHSAVDFGLKVTSATDVTLGSTTATPTITGTVTLKGSGKTSTGFTLHPNLNGTDLKTTTFAASKNSDGSYTGTFSYQLPSDAGLTSGKNTLTLTATDDATGYTSTDGTVNLSVGKLDWGVVNTGSSFKDTELTGTGQIIGRNSDWRVEVNNQTGTNWKMTAALTKPFTDTDKPGDLAGKLIYKSSANADPITMSAAAVEIADQTSNPGSGTLDVSQDWGANSGMLLSVSGAATAGTYQGQITWTLENAE